MCETILIQVKETNLFYPFELEEYASADRVSYDFYAGRVKLFTSEYGEASQRLSRAFFSAPRGSLHNKKLILRNLICVNLMLGKYPPMKILRKYGMNHYEKLVRSCAKGDLKTFFSELSRNQTLWMKKGTYLLLERTKIVAYRNFLLRVCKVISKGDWRFDLQNFRIAFKMMNVHMEESEVECILSNLIGICLFLVM